MGYDSGDSFPFDLTQIEYHLVQNRKENCKLKKLLKGNIVSSAFYLDTIFATRARHKISQGKQGIMRINEAGRATRWGKKVLPVTS